MDESNSRAENSSIARAESIESRLGEFKLYGSDVIITTIDRRTEIPFEQHLEAVYRYIVDSEQHSVP